MTGISGSPCFREVALVGAAAQRIVCSCSPIFISPRKPPTEGHVWLLVLPPRAGGKKSGINGAKTHWRMPGLLRLDAEMPPVKPTDPQNERLPLGFPRKARVAAPCSAHPAQYVRLTKTITVVSLPLPLSWVLAHNLLRCVKHYSGIPSGMVLNLTPENLFQCSL